MSGGSLMRLLDSLSPPPPKLVWFKAHSTDPVNEARGFRKDGLGNWIHRDRYGRRDSEYGWEMDHIYPSSMGGSDGIGNVRPLHWRANVAKSDTVPAIAALARLFAQH